MRPPPRTFHLATTIAVLGVAAVSMHGVAGAWTAIGLGAGTARATAVAAAPAPTASLSAGAVEVRWSPGPIAGSYTVRRFDASGSPAIPAGGCGSTIATDRCVESPAPTGTWAYAVRASRAAWSAPLGPTGAPVVVGAADVTPPIVSAVAVGPPEGTSSGWVRPSGSYRVFASASDAVEAASGIATVRADVSEITGSTTVIDLVAGGPWWIGGETFGWRSAAFSAAPTLPDGTDRLFAVTATDLAGNASSRGGRTTVDTTPPGASDIQTVAGGTAGKADAGDRVVFTFSDSLNPASLLAGWTGQAATTVVVRITDGGTGPDVLTVWDAANTTQVALGSVSLERTDYVTGSVSFGSPTSPSAMVLSGAVVTVTLGPPSLASRVGAGTGTGTMVWTPSSAATDRAGNPCSTVARSESGSKDREF